MNNKLITHFIQLLQQSQNGDKRATAKIEALSQTPEKAELIEICRKALAQVTKEGIAKTQNRSEAPQRTGRFANRCTVCDRPAIPGDSVCYTHNN